jgi:pSer/pThr/pTyr-binding forkhead associated (FHA) protein
VLSADQARAAGFVREEVVLVVDGRRHRVTKRTTTMGRSRDCDIVIPDPNVSRVHAELRHAGEDYLLVDLDSTNGTEVNGRAVKRHVLADGDRVRLGTSQIVVERR